MDGHKTVCPPNATMKRPHVTAAVTKMRSLAAITRHESGKDFSWGGGQTEPYQPPSIPTNWGHTVTGDRKSVPSPWRFFCGLAP